MSNQLLFSMLCSWRRIFWRGWRWRGEKADVAEQTFIYHLHATKCSHKTAPVRSNCNTSVYNLAICLESSKKTAVINKRKGGKGNRLCKLH